MQKIIAVDITFASHARDPTTRSSRVRAAHACFLFQESIIPENLEPFDHLRSFNQQYLWVESYSSHHSVNIIGTN